LSGATGVQDADFGNEVGFVLVISTIAIEVEGLAEEAQDLAPGVKAAVEAQVDDFSKGEGIVSAFYFG